MYRDQLIDMEVVAKSFSIFCIGAIENMPKYENIKDKLAADIGRVVEANLSIYKKRVATKGNMQTMVEEPQSSKDDIGLLTLQSCRCAS